MIPVFRNQLPRGAKEHSYTPPSCFLLSEGVTFYNGLVRQIEIFSTVFLHFTAQDQIEIFLGYATTIRGLHSVLFMITNDADSDIIDYGSLENKFLYLRLALIDSVRLHWDMVDYVTWFQAQERQVKGLKTER